MLNDSPTKLTNTLIYSVNNNNKYDYLFQLTIFNGSNFSDPLVMLKR